MKNRHFRALVWFSLEEKLVLKKLTDIFRDSGRVSVREHKILNSIDRSGTEGGTREREKKGPTEGGSWAERLSPDGHGRLLLGPTRLQCSVSKDWKNDDLPTC